MTLTVVLGLAKRNPFAMEMNVLVIGMPNVGKSSLINALRNVGISGRAFHSQNDVKLKLTCGNVRHAESYADIRKSGPYTDDIDAIKALGRSFNLFC